MLGCGPAESNQVWSGPGLNNYRRSTRRPPLKFTDKFNCSIVIKTYPNLLSREFSSLVLKTTPLQSPPRTVIPKTTVNNQPLLLASRRRRRDTRKHGKLTNAIDFGFTHDNLSSDYWHHKRLPVSVQSEWAEVKTLSDGNPRAVLQVSGGQWRRRVCIMAVWKDAANECRQSHPRRPYSGVVGANFRCVRELFIPT